MTEVTPIGARKLDHIQINLNEDVQSGLSTGLERYRFPHRALPELNLNEVDLSQELFSRLLKAPILISSMTGGNDQAIKINRNLAIAAEEMGVAMGIGSQRAAIEHPELVHTFQVRAEAPNVLLLANLGAVQLNYGYGISHCQKAVDMVGADALVLHFNALQEAVQPEGNTNFFGLVSNVEKICKALSVPVIAKEVGWGFSVEDIRMLANAGVDAIDVAGAGGTSWSQVEMHRAKNESQRRLAAAFVDWGIPTSEAILNVRKTAPDILIFASGGLRSGVDIAKCISLGARIGGMASPFLRAADQSSEMVVHTIEELRRELQICMFAAGAGNLQALRNTRLIET